MLEKFLNHPTNFTNIVISKIGLELRIKRKVCIMNYRFLLSNTNNLTLPNDRKEVML